MAIRRRKIQTLIESLLVENGITEAPVPVSQIAKAKGARIFVDSLQGDLSGFLYRDKDKVVIGVNSHHAKARMNFTIAHELGHLLLHDQEPLHVDHDFRVRLRDDESSKGTDEAEREANSSPLPSACRNTLSKRIWRIQTISIFSMTRFFSNWRENTASAHRP